MSRDSSLRGPHASARSATSPVPPSELVGSIYEAAVDPHRWAEVIGRVHAWVGGAAGGFTVRTTWPELSTSQVWTGIDPAFERAYAAHHFRHDPWFERAAFEPGTTLLSQELISEEDLLKSPFYNELCQPFGVRDVQTSMLLRSERRLVSFAMFRSDGAKFDQSTKDRQQALTPHLTRAVSIALELDERARSASVLAAATHARRLGVVRVDAGLNVLAEPEGASAWLASDGGPLSVVRRRLATGDADDQAALRAAVAGAIRGVATSVVLGRRAGDHVSVLVVPVPSPSPLSAEQSAHVLFSPPADAARADALRSAFALTAAEARVAVKVGRGQPLRTIATDLGVSYHTVRAHLRQCFAKTGARRQSALAALVHGSA